MSAPPRVLVDPPWRRRSAPAATPTPSMPRVGPRLVWREGEREELARSATTPLGGDRAEAHYERLLERIDEGKPIPVAELDRLPDDLLGELAADLTPSTIDVAGLRRMLARLGDAFAARAASLIRGRPPESGLFSAAVALEASELAPVAAALFAKTDLVEAESDAERWLVRFADAALAGLVGQGDAASRAALAYVAARAGAAVGAELSAIATLAPSDRELAWRVARGEHEAVLARLTDASDAVAPFVALALAGSARASAQRWLESRGGAIVPLLEARADDAKARAALELLRGDASAGDPALLDVPAQIPRLPSFVRADALARPRLRDGTELTDDAVMALAEMIRFSPLERPYAGVAHVRSACDPGSLDAFALALLEAWIAAGSEPLERWALDAAGKIGGDACAREVGARVRGWASGATPPRSAWDSEERRVVILSEGDRGWAYARAGVSALGAIGSDLALTTLDDLARNGAVAWLRKEAAQALERAGGRRGGRAKELEDDMVPDLGLDADGSATLDLGARSFRVGFDEQLVPRLSDDSGALVPFPRKRKTDDDARFAEAKARWAALVRDAKVLARQQIGALEVAMCEGRTWRADAFRARFLEHPVLRHLARRLVWAVREGDAVVASFRGAEDLSLADEHDELFVLRADAKVCVAHPIELAEATRARWIELFADYEILQPFAQNGRERVALEADERETEIAAVAEKPTSRGRLFGLGRRGWRARAADGLLFLWERDLPRSGTYAGVQIEPGLFVDGAEQDAQVVTRAWTTVPLGRLPLVDRIELLRDLAWLVAAG